jgi:large subunit ribosomal protein L18e
MMKRTKSTNPLLVNAIRVLRKKARENNANIWRDIADRLSSSRRRSVTVSVSQLNRQTKKGEAAVVPGKILGLGNIDHPIIAAAFSFSETARLKIRKAKGVCTSIPELAEKNPTGKNVKIIG